MISVTIPAGATPTSDAVDLYGQNMIGIVFPSMVGTSVSFLVEKSDGTFVALYDTAGALRTVTVPTGGGIVTFDSLAEWLIRKFKVKSNGTETAAVTVSFYTRML